LVGYVTRARVTMPKSTREYIMNCGHYRERLHAYLQSAHRLP
jgi:hypothetical protein